MLFITLILECLYLLAPSGIANIVPKLAAHFKILKSFDKPIDSGKTYRGYRITGDHKTYRGFIVGVFCGIVVGFIQYLLSGISFFSDHSLINYSNLGLALLSGGLLGLGSLTGDAIKSFFKRQFDVAPGKSWFPFDQIDFILGSFLFIWPIVNIDWRYFVISIAVFFVGHMLANVIGHLVGVNDNWI